MKRGGGVGVPDCTCVGGIYLDHSVLAGTVLAGAVLSGTVLSGTVLAGAFLVGSVLSDTVLGGGGFQQRGLIHRRFRARDPY
ncbi:pentapeptide repeat-containing protein [Arthrobacter sp. ISL-28]|nr:pentapeptide repeat-containing protein [Arthrobacter sp. ISL-28]